MFQSWRLTLLSATLLLSMTVIVSSFFAPLSSTKLKSFAVQNQVFVRNNYIVKSAQSSCLYGAQITEFDYEDEDDGDALDTRTDEEKGLTHGYEGDFKVGDVVKVRLMFPAPKEHSSRGAYIPTAHERENHSVAASLRLLYNTFTNDSQYWNTEARNVFLHHIFTLLINRSSST